MARLRKREPTSRPSRPIPTRPAACTRAAIRISGEARTAGRPGRTRRRSPAPPATCTSRRPTATMWSSLSADGCWSRPTRSAPSRSRTSRAICLAVSSRASPSIPTIRQPSTPCSAGSAASRAGTSSAPRSPQRRGPTSLRRSTCRSTRSRSTAARCPPPSTPERTSACCAPSTAARTGACSTISTSRGAPVFDLAFHNGELRAATFGRGVFSFVKPTGPAIAVGLEDGLAFGTVCPGSTHYLTIEVSNVGVADLVITSVQRLMGSTDFTVLPNPATPLILAAGEDIEFTVAYSPTGRRDPRPRRSGSSPTTRPRRSSTSLATGSPGNQPDRDGDRQFRQLRQRLPRRVRRRTADDQQFRDLPAPDLRHHRVRRTSSRRACCPTLCSSARATRSTWSSVSSLRRPTARRRA